MGSKTVFLAGMALGVVVTLCAAGLAAQTPTPSPADDACSARMDVLASKIDQVAAAVAQLSDRKAPDATSSPASESLKTGDEVLEAIGRLNREINGMNTALQTIANELQSSQFPH